MVKQYIGARYVPVFDGEYNSEKAYEPLTIVTYLNNSYTSKKTVPAGTLPSNTEYWALTGNYNAQIEEYRQEVEGYHQDVEEYKRDVDEFKEEVAETISAIDIHGKSILIIGDSNSDAAVVARNWAVQFKELAEEAGATVTIDGMNGACIIAEGGVPSLHSRYIASARNYDYVIIELGVNDWIFGHELGDLDSAFVDFSSDVTTETKIPEVYWIMPFKTNDSRQRRIPLDVYRSFYADTCRRYGFRMIDGTNAPMVNLRYANYYYRQDGYNIHPNELGSTFIARYVFHKFLSGGDNELTQYYSSWQLTSLIPGVNVWLRMLSNSMCILHIYGDYTPTLGRQNLVDFSDLAAEGIKYAQNGQLANIPISGEAGDHIALLNKDSSNIYLWNGNWSQFSYTINASIPFIINPYPNDMGLYF